MFNFKWLSEAKNTLAGYKAVEGSEIFLMREKIEKYPIGKDSEERRKTVTMLTHLLDFMAEKKLDNIKIKTGHYLTDPKELDRCLKNNII